MINYILQVILFQILFLTVYDFFLHKETFFKWNRFYLIITPFLALTIPLIKMESFQNNIAKEYITYLPEVVINPQIVIEQTINSGNTNNYLTLLYYSGAVVFTGLFLIKLFKIIKLIITNGIIKKATYSLVILKGKEVAFSFFNYIFISDKLLKNNDLQIIQHELIHVKQKHTLDLLLFEILKITQWFNPIIYLFQKRITILHEYISDDEIVKQTNPKTYFNKLLAQTFNVENITFINQFYKQTLIKKRIVMITKEKSKKMKQLKYLLIAPLLVAMLIFSSFQKRSLEISKNENLKIMDTINPNNSIPFALIEKVPVYPGCEGTESELKKCLQENISKYINRNFNADLANKLNLPSGIKRIFVMFNINKEGVIDNVRARAEHKKLEEEAIRVIKSLPQMKPGKQKGKVVNVKYSLPIAFMVDSKNPQQKSKSLKSVVGKYPPIYILDGKEISEKELNELDANKIKSMNVLKGESAIKKYGVKGKNGVVVILKK